MERMHALLRVVPVLAVLLGIVSCGSSTIPIPASALNGNWNFVTAGALTANPVPPSPFVTGPNPSIQFAIVAVGNQIFANGTYSSPCGTVGGAIIGATGKIASDGTFQMVVNEPLDSTGKDSLAMLLSGTLPASNSSNWTGAYSISNPGPTVSGCAWNQSGTFIAEAMKVVDGTYVGSPPSGQLTAPSINVTAALIQGAPTSSINGLGEVGYYLPLQGTILVSGNSCFTSGTTMQGTGSQLAGDFVTARFAMNDGSELLVVGYFNEADESIIELAQADVTGGKCAGRYSSGNMTLQ